MSRYYIIEADVDPEFYRGPFRSISSAKAYIKSDMSGLYRSNDRPLRDILDEDGDTKWSTAEYIIVQEVERLQVTPRVKIEIDLTTL